MGITRYVARIDEHTDFSQAPPKDGRAPTMMNYF